MTAQQALCHLADSLEAVRGNRTMTMPPLPALQRLVMKWGALYLPVPWPLGAMTNLEWQRWAHLHFDHHLRQFSV